MTNVGAFFDDTFRLGERLTLNLGLRYDHSKASLPDAPVLDTQGNETSEIVPGIDTVYTWNVASPRLGFSWKLNKSGRSVLKAHYGRYYRGVITGEFDDAAASVSARYLFAGTYDAAGNPEGAELVSDNTNKRVDPNFKNPYTDQFTGQFEQELTKDLALSIGYVYKRGNLYGGWNDVGGVYETVGYVDDNPDDPNATGRTIPVFQLQNDPAERLFLLTNPSEMFSRYKGGTLVLTKRMSHHWQAVASLVVSKSTGRLGSSTQGLKSSQTSSAGSFGQNPNDFINTDGRLVGDRPVLFKVQAVYEAPLGFHFGLNFVHQTGRPWSRQVRVGDVVGIPTTILAEPITGDRRVTDWNIFDLSAQKNIKLGAKAELDLFAYFLNLTNSTVFEDVLDRRGTSDTFGLGTSYFPPRRIMLGAHFRF
jgi:hypothetical protein